MLLLHCADPIAPPRQTMQSSATGEFGSSHPETKIRLRPEGLTLHYSTKMSDTRCGLGLKWLLSLNNPDQHNGYRDEQQQMNKSSERG